MLISLNANAKINLYLEVNEKRPDGFHNIKSIMHSVSLSDRVEVEAVPSEETQIRIECSDKTIPEGDGNIAYRAAELFLMSFKIKSSVNIRIEKNIPHAAGLAGGSADCAAILVALSRIFSIYDDEKFGELAAYLGSDVPFCLKGGCAAAEGRGELLTFLPPITQINGGDNSVYIVIAVGEDGVSTPYAYSLIDEKYSADDRQESFLYIKNAVQRRSLDDVMNLVYNSFEDVIFPVRCDAERLKREFIFLGADCALMSGSGASVFGIFNSADTAENAVLILKKEGRRVFMCRPAESGVELL